MIFNLPALRLNPFKSFPIPKPLPNPESPSTSNAQKGAGRDHTTRVAGGWGRRLKK